MRCDDRLEVRLTSGDKTRVEQHAEAASLTVSELVRRSLMAALNGRWSNQIEERREVEALRRRANAIEARLLRLEASPGLPAHVATAIKDLDRDAMRLHGDAEELLRC